MAVLLLRRFDFNLAYGELDRRLKTKALGTKPEFAKKLCRIGWFWKCMRWAPCVRQKPGLAIIHVAVTVAPAYG